MASDTIGPGLRKFREAAARGEQVDVLALMDEYPSEALAIVDEVQVPIKHDRPMMREHMWLARDEVERDAGRDADLGAMLRAEREYRGITVADLARSVQVLGVDLDAATLERLEANQGVDIDPGSWAAVVAELELDPYHVVANIRRSLSPLRAEGEPLSGAMLSREPTRDVADYLDRVRSALGIPTAPPRGDVTVAPDPTRAETPAVSPVRDLEDITDVQAHIDRIFNAQPDGRAEAIRQMFVEVLDFNQNRGQVPLSGAPDGVDLPRDAERVAEIDGVHVVYVALDSAATNRVRRAEVSEAAQLIARELGDDQLLVFTDRDVSQLQLVLPDLTGSRPTLRRMVVERYLRQRTAVEQIARIYRGPGDTRSARSALAAAFNVEPVTKRFFAEYKRVFEQVEQSVTGFAAGEDEERRLFVQTLFNRLMFVYFLQRKGWLEFRSDKDYLKALWNDYRQKRRETDNFHDTRLRNLFFARLNNPDSRDVTAEIDPLTGKVPFLNGGLFEQGNLDERDGVTVPDEAIEAVLTEIFDHFNFTVMESTPFDIEVAVDPEMLGKVFEELVTGRHASGSYYTPRTVVSFMCREALKGYLEARDTGLTPDIIAGFVDEHRTDAIDIAAARRVAGALSDVTVVDPACGSGAYLLGMMQELVELQTVLFNAGADARSLYELKIEIIERNLRGVDIDPFAVNIAMLRMWLSLAIEYEGEHPDPLPNLDLTIVTGDSLLAAHSSDAEHAEGGVQGTFGDQTAELQALKARYMHESAGPSKAALRAEIAELDRNLQQRFGGSGVADAAGGVVWRSAFAEAFAARSGRAGGFDIVLANPPYHQLQRDGGRLANLYRHAGYQTFERTGDIYQLFYERGCELLTPRTGILAYITSNSWLRAKYGESLRSYLAKRHTPLRWLDLGKDVFDSAIVDSGVLLLGTGGESAAFPAVDMDQVPSVGFPPAEEHWGRVRPDADAPWSILSIAEQSAMDKMLAFGTPLGKWGLRINRGITTGYNGAFIIDDETRQALVAEDPKSAEVIRPVLRGRDIRRYMAQWADLWLIDTHNGYGDVSPVDVDDYPSHQGSPRQILSPVGEAPRQRQNAVQPPQLLLPRRLQQTEVVLDEDVSGSAICLF